MPRLKGKHKSFIVRHLACYDNPMDVVRQVKETFDIEASVNQVSYYNPNTPQGSRELSDKWKVLFEETRKDYLEDAKKHPIMHKGYRIGELEDALAMAKKKKDYNAMRKILETAAKEAGGKFEGDDIPYDRRDSEQNFYQQINQKIIQAYGTEEEKAELAQKELTEA